MKKCTLVAHKEENASSYCQDCKIYMCNQCEKYHEALFNGHHQYKLDKNNDSNTEIFTGICGEKNHSSELNFFCKTHNKLCCIECFIKIKDNNYGKHKDCGICIIENIKEEKKNKLKENINNLENMNMNNFENLKQTIDELKIKLENNNKIKEELKINIQNKFSKLIVDLNNREDELLMQVDKNFDLLLNENMIKESENLPNKIKTSLAKGKLIENQWDKEKLNSLINDCLNIENNINYIEILIDNIKKGKTSNLKFYFYSEGENQISELIKNFGRISDNKIFNSVIEFDEELVKSWLNNREFNSELLFRKSRDGSLPKDFHDKCDNKGNTIVFIETTNGYKFGGYTELQWDKSGRNKKDNSTFIFSFNNKQKYIAINNYSTIGCYKNVGPFFGCDYPEIYLKNTLDLGQSYLGQSNLYNTFLTERKLTNGEEIWEVKELEVFKINYI